MLENQNSQGYYESKEKIERSIAKTVLIRVLCFAICFILIWQGYGVFKRYIEKANDIEGVEWVIPLSHEFDYEAVDAYITKNSFEEIGLGLVTREEKVEKGLYSHYETYFGVEDKNGKVIIQPKYDYLDIDEEGNYIMASYYNHEEEKTVYTDLKNVVHYYNFDGSDYVSGNYCKGGYFHDGYAIVQVPREEPEDFYFKKKILVINENGEVVYESPYNNLSNIPGLEGCFMEYNKNLGLGYTTSTENKMGIVNIKGEILVPFEYNSIECNKEQQIIYLRKTDEKGKRILYCMDYQFNPIPVDELWKFRENHKFEYINPIERDVDYNIHETIIMEEFFKNARTVNEDKNGWHIVNGNKEIIADFPDCMKMYDFSEGVTVVEYEDKIKYVDTNGDVLFEIKKAEGCELEEEYGAKRFYNGTIEFVEDKSRFLGNDYKVGLLDKTGKVLIPAEFDHIGRIFNDGKTKQVIVRKNHNYGVVKVNK